MLGHLRYHASDFGRADVKPNFLPRIPQPPT
jgi:hypothetical protein